MTNSDNAGAFLLRHGLEDLGCANHFGPGWNDLLDRLVADLRAAGWDGDLHQVKQKFGKLCFYTGKLTDGQQRILDQAEEVAGRTCEGCGAAGTTCTERASAPRCCSWVRTLCDYCHRVLNR